MQVLREKSEKASKLADEKEDERAKVQGELDDLLMVLGDLEDKVGEYRGKVKELGGEVSDDEDDEDGEEEDGDEEEGEEGDVSGVD